MKYTEIIIILFLLLNNLEHFTDDVSLNIIPFFIQYKKGPPIEKKILFL